MGKKKVRVMMFKSRVPALVGEKQVRENRIVSVQEISDGTGLSKPTIYKWMGKGERFKVLEPDSAYALCRYFDCTLNDLVEIVPGDKDAA